jgi:CheY-like chemotaxis protein
MVAAPTARDTRSPVSVRERIITLVVDYDRWTRLNVSMMLAEAGFDVEQASNGVTALRIAAIAQPHIVLLRHNLPEVGAVDVLASLKADPRTRHCAVVQLQEAGHTECSLAVDGSLELPCQPVELLAAVIDALETRQATRRSAVERQPDVAVPMRSVSAPARGARSLVGGGAVQATSRMRNAGRSGKARFNNGIETL